MADRFPTVVLGSRNRKKVGEMAELLAPHGVKLVSVEDFPAAQDVVEDGQTFAENAAKKGRETALATGQWVIAEDSGLCVDALHGAPGIYSARFAGQHGDDAANNTLLLERLAEVPTDRRTAYYVCSAVLASPDGEIAAVAEGRCSGRILREFRGIGGFGYDPLFLVPEYHCTFGELPAVVKRHVSHRAKAFERLIPKMLRALSSVR